MDEDDDQPAAEDPMRPRATVVPIGPPRWDGGKRETATGDPIDLQDWDYRAWRRR
ncbi:hypothetical protein GCM10011583_57660 [Streptomyces camponoticapitis]|uniref:Uncharacterized protein n=1 Tax=Streptomyces camponoticapitis TaxID=1616125 RepID=A0ABQ2ENT3_9ACTN|nr:hypothetical protein [Streptomyces camponoticapitis]GGK18254.1 hypothetical protein GCM10011583_57660 [Streptomyces camponoticapitis]